MNPVKLYVILIWVFFRRWILKFGIDKKTRLQGETVGEVIKKLGKFRSTKKSIKDYLYALDQLEQMYAENHEDSQYLCSAALGFLNDRGSRIPNKSIQVHEKYVDAYKDGTVAMTFVEARKIVDQLIPEYGLYLDYARIPEFYSMHIRRSEFQFAIRHIVIRRRRKELKRLLKLAS